MKSMYYTERLQWLRDCNNVTQRETAAYLGIKPQQYSRYEKGVNVMPVTYVPRICEFFDISADYLLGLIDDEVKLSIKREKSKIRVNFVSY